MQTSSIGGYPSAHFREGILFMDINHTQDRAANTDAHHLYTQDNNTNISQGSTFYDHPTYRQNTNRSNSRVASTLHSYNLRCGNDAKPVTIPKDKDLTCRGTYNALPARALKTSRQQASSYNTDRGQRDRTNNFLDEISYSEIHKPACDKVSYRSETTTNADNDRSLGRHTPPNTTATLNILDAEEHTYMNKQQSRMREDSRNTRFKPYIANDVQISQRSPKQDRHCTIREQRIPYAKQITVRDNSNGRHYGVSLFEGDTDRDNDKQTRTEYDQPERNHFPYDRSTGVQFRNSQNTNLRDESVQHNDDRNSELATRVESARKLTKERENSQKDQTSEGLIMNMEDEELSDLPALWPYDEQRPQAQSTKADERCRANPMIPKDHNVQERTEIRVLGDQSKNSRWLGAPVKTPAEYAGTQPVEKVVKLPAFTGKGSWKVWYNRFNTIAQLNKWDETTKLNQLLPRLEGDAGDFVYGELPQEITCDFKKLIDELESRFRMIETHKTYEAQFSKRNQLPGETTEEYAADLKRLYDKAHVKRNPESRRECLLRRFLNGLADDQARFEVEYHKDPSNIDEAVSHVVNYMEARKAPNTNDFRDGEKTRRKNVTFLNRDSSDSEDSDSDFRNEMRLRLKKRKRSVRKVVKTDKKDAKSADIECSEGESSSASTNTLRPSLKTQIEKIIESKLNESQSKKEADEHRTPSRSRNQIGRDRVQCFFCRDYGHYQRECPEIVREQAPIPQRNHEWRRGVQPPRHSEEAEKNQATGKAKISLN